MNKEGLSLNLRRFTGSESWFKHWASKNITYTEGVKFLAEEARAFWLIDEIILSQSLDIISKEDFQVWTLKVSENNTAALTCEDGNEAVIFSKIIDFTDFPLDEVTLFFTNNVLLLPSEN